METPRIHATEKRCILTKFIGPTEKNLLSFVRAKSGPEAVRIVWDDNKTVDQNHDAAAIALCERYDWNPACLARGCNVNGNAYLLLDAVPGQIQPEEDHPLDLEAYGTMCARLDPYMFDPQYDVGLACIEQEARDFDKIHRDKAESLGLEYGPDYWNFDEGRDYWIALDERIENILADFETEEE